MKLRIHHKELLKKLSHSPNSLKKFTHGDNQNGLLVFHYKKYLDELMAAGFIVEDNEIFHITTAGKNALEDQSVPLAKARTIVGIGTYDGAELIYRVDRIGAYDFLKYPSKMGESRVYPKC